MAKNQKKIQLRCLFHKFSFTYINHGYWAAILKNNYLWLLLLFPWVLHKKLLFSHKLISYPHILFHLKIFLWKGPLTVKVRKKFIDEILSYISFCFENICFVNIFDLFISRTEKIAWRAPVFKSDFYIFSYNDKFRKTWRNFIDNKIYGNLLYHTSLRLLYNSLW